VRVDLFQGLADVHDAVAVLRRWRQKVEHEFNNLIREVERFARKLQCEHYETRSILRSFRWGNAAEDESP
jgi:hypothetical protein